MPRTLALTCLLDLPHDNDPVSTTWVDVPTSVETQVTVFETPTHRQRDILPPAPSAPSNRLLLPPGQHVPEVICQLFPPESLPQSAVSWESKTLRGRQLLIYSIGTHGKSTSKSESQSQSTADIVPRLEPVTETVTVTPESCLSGSPHTYPVPRSWPMVTPTTSSVHVHTPSPTSTHKEKFWPPVFPEQPPAEVQPPHHEPPQSPPVLPFHHWTPPAVIGKSTSCTTSHTTITSHPCSTCSPKVWTSAKSIPAPPSVPSVTHSSWSTPSAPVLAESKPTSHSTSSTASWIHSYSTTHPGSHVFDEATPSPKHWEETSTFKPPFEMSGGAKKTHGSVMAMVAFVVAAVVMSAFT